MFWSLVLFLIGDPDLCHPLFSCSDLHSVLDHRRYHRSSGPVDLVKLVGMGNPVDVVYGL